MVKITDLRTVMTESTYDEEVVKSIKKDCAFYLSSIFKGTLFRGAMSPELNAADMPFGDYKIYKLSIRESRTPSASSKNTTETLNNMYAKLDTSITRNNCIYAGSMGQAVQYGSPHLLLPIGKFEALWNNKIEDAFLTFEGSYTSKYYYKLTSEKEQAVRSKVEKEFDHDLFYMAMRQKNNETDIKHPDKETYLRKEATKWLADFKKTSGYKAKLREKTVNELTSVAYLEGHLDQGAVEEKYLEHFQLDPINGTWNPKVEVMIRCPEYYLMGVKTFNMLEMHL